MMGLTILLKLFCAACKVNVIGFIKSDLNNLQKETILKNLGDNKERKVEKNGKIVIR